MASPIPPEEPPIQFSDSYTVITHRPKAFEVYHVHKEKLEILESGYTSPHAAMFGVAFGAAVAFYTTYSTVPLAEPLETRFLMFTVISILASIYLGIMAARDFTRARRAIKGIKDDTITETQVMRYGKN